MQLRGYTAGTHYISLALELNKSFSNGFFTVSYVYRIVITKAFIVLSFYLY